RMREASYRNVMTAKSIAHCLETPVEAHADNLYMAILQRRNRHLRPVPRSSRKTKIPDCRY
ncbi:hypothetical protein Tco_0594628, partial [Tanacetum coccineum]